MKNLSNKPIASLRFTFVLFALGLMQTKAFAQKNFVTQSPFNLQADAGVSIASLKMSILGTDNDELKSILGFQGRLLAGYTFTENLSLHSGLGLVQLGALIEHEDHHDEIRIQALEIPLLFRYRLPVGPGSLALSAGPALAYHLSAIEHGHESDQEEETELSIGNDPSDFVKPLNLGIQAELSFTHQSGILINLRYNAGLLDLGTVDAVEMQTSYLAVGLGYRLF
jgi:hypothetical protein